MILCSNIEVCSYLHQFYSPNIASKQSLLESFKFICSKNELTNFSEKKHTQQCPNNLYKNFHEYIPMNGNNFQIQWEKRETSWWSKNCILLNDPLDKRVFSSLPLYNKHVFRLVWSVLSIRLGSVHYRIDAITLLLCHLSSEVGSFGLAVLWDRAYRFLLDIG